MDPVTHAVAGALAAVMILPSEDRLKAASVGAVAGIFPDIDLIPLAFMDDLAKISFHRGPTHSLLFALVCSLVLGTACARHYRARGPSRRAWMTAAVIAMMTHLVVDCLTGYGTMLFLPFGTARIAFSVMCPLDPLFTLPAAGVLALSLLASTASVPVRRIAAAGIIFMAAYAGMTTLVKRNVIAETRALLAGRGTRFNSVIATPTFGGPFLWNIIVITNECYFTGYRSVFDGRRLDLFPLRSGKALLQDRDFGTIEAIFDAFTGGYYSVEAVGDGLVVTDLRYGRVPSDGGVPVPVISYRVSGNGGAGSIEQVRHDPGHMREALAFFISRLAGNNF